MASEQCVKNEELELNYEEEATLNELVQEAECQLTDNTMKEAFSFLSKNEPTLDKAQGATLVGGAMKNTTKGDLSSCPGHIWSGHYMKDPPRVLHGTGAFVQTAMAKDGCKAAVVYAGKSKAGTECGWLLAWHDARGGVRKVYVECGKKSSFNNINWPEIEKKLNKGSYRASYTDPSTKTKVYATILGTAGKAAVAAGFSG